MLHVIHLLHISKVIDLFDYKVVGTEIFFFFLPYDCSTYILLVSVLTNIKSSHGFYTFHQ